MMETTTKIAIDWADVDAMRHVNNLALLRYIQTARVNICHASGVMPVVIAPEQGPIVAEIEIKFLKPLFYPGEVTVVSRVSGHRRTSFTLSHTIIGPDGGIVAEESEVIVNYDYVQGRKLPLPEEFITNIES